MVKFRYNFCHVTCLSYGLKAMSYLSDPYLTDTFFRPSHYHIPKFFFHEYENSEPYECSLLFYT